jgi:hypothetical protein
MAQGMPGNQVTRSQTVMESRGRKQVFVLTVRIWRTSLLVLKLPTQVTQNCKLNKLLDFYNQGGTDFLAPLESDHLEICSAGEIIFKKHLATQDYVTRVIGLFSNQEDTLVNTAGVNITFRSNTKI